MISQHLPDVINPINVLMSSELNQIKRKLPRRKKLFHFIEIILMDWEMLGKQGAGQPAAVPKSQVQAQVQPIANVVVPKLKRRRPMGRPRKAINLSLKSLSDVINALVKKHEHVPYRDSVLTHVLQPYLGKDAKTLMVVNITPTRSSVEETMTSMRFASTAFGSAAVTVQQKSLLHGDSSRRKSPRWS